MTFKVDISKPTVSLTKSNPTVDLRKKGSDNWGRVTINLNWSQGGSQIAQPQARPGLLKSMLGGNVAVVQPPGIDLDLGCLFEHEDGSIGCVQALGNNFGSFRDFPYVQLSQDDRTGASTEGEFLYLNGDRWTDFRRLLVFAFIYDGVPDWSAADGRVVVSIPGQRSYEVRMDEATRGLSMCAIALLENTGNQIRATRLARYFRGHEEMDHAFHWGLRWKAGSKD